MSTTTLTHATHQHVDWKPLGMAAGIFLALTYSICIVWDLVAPSMAMHESWQQLLPGFTWLSWGSFFLGLAETFVYGFYFSLIFAPLYNFFSGRMGANKRS